MHIVSSFSNNNICVASSNYLEFVIIHVHPNAKILRHMYLKYKKKIPNDTVLLDLLPAETFDSACPSC